MTLAQDQQHIGKQVSFEIGRELFKAWEDARLYSRGDITRLHVAIFYSPLRRVRVEPFGKSYPRTAGPWQRIVHPLPLASIPAHLMDRNMS